MAERKGLRVELKDADETKGEVTAVFATFNVKDKDWDVTLPGAFEDGASVLISPFGHKVWEGALPVGKGTISSTKTEGVFTGQYFMDTQAGADNFHVVKNTIEQMEWSYGYDPVEYKFGEFEGERVRFLMKQKVHEVSPVIIGAGENTRTVAAKSGGIKFSDEAQAVLTALESLSARAADVVTKRLEQGKALGADSTALLEQIHAEADRLKALLAAEPTPEHEDELAREYARFVSRNLR